VELLGGVWEDTSALVQVMAELLQHSEQLALAAASKAAEARGLRADLADPRQKLGMANQVTKPSNGDGTGDEATAALSGGARERQRIRELEDEVARMQTEVARLHSTHHTELAGTLLGTSERQLAKVSVAPLKARPAARPASSGEQERVQGLEDELAQLRTELTRTQETLSAAEMEVVETNSHMLKLKRELREESQAAQRFREHWEVAQAEIIKLKDQARGTKAAARRVTQCSGWGVGPGMVLGWGGSWHGARVGVGPGMVLGWGVGTSAWCSGWEWVPAWCSGVGGGSLHGARWGVGPAWCSGWGMGPGMVLGVGVGLPHGGGSTNQPSALPSYWRPAAQNLPVSQFQAFPE
ncbi:hypothetical protein CYMTET_35457, partial [Cymbomonas tetramitiformis]